MYKIQIVEALKKVVSEHGYIHANGNPDINEVTLAHRLAHHLENSGWFSGYNIDCEYNRNMNKPKKDVENNIFRPDIIIHKRNSNDANLIMIETKKFNDPPQEIQAEGRRLLRNARHYEFKHAFLVIFPEDAVQLQENRHIIEII